MIWGILFGQIRGGVCVLYGQQTSLLRPKSTPGKCQLGAVQQNWKTCEGGSHCPDLMGNRSSTVNRTIQCFQRCRPVVKRGVFNILHSALDSFLGTITVAFVYGFGASSGRDRRRAH